MGEETDPNGWLSGGSGSTGKPSNKKRRGAVIGLVTAGLVAGGVLAGTLGASAATAPTSGGSYEGPHGGPPFGEGGARPGGPGGRHHFDEKKVSAAITATLTKKALAKVPGATVDHVGQRPDGTYDVLLTKSDKTHVMVRFDKNLNLTGVETGPPKGTFGPGGPGRNGVPNGEFKPGGPRGFGGPGGHGPGRPPTGGPEAPVQG